MVLAAAPCRARRSDAYRSRGSIVGAGSVVTSGKQFPENSLILGSPAKVIRALEPDQISIVDAQSYQRNGPRYRKGLKKIG